MPVFLIALFSLGCYNSGQAWVIQLLMLCLGFEITTLDALIAEPRVETVESVSIVVSFMYLLSEGTNSKCCFSCENRKPLLLVANFRKPLISAAIRHTWRPCSFSSLFLYPKTPQDWVPVLLDSLQDLVWQVLTGVDEKENGNQDAALTQHGRHLPRIQYKDNAELSIGVEGVYARRCPTVRNRSQPSAFVRNRLQPFAGDRVRSVLPYLW